MIPEMPLLPLLPESGIPRIDIQTKRMPMSPSAETMGLSNVRQMEAYNYSKAMGVAFEQSRINNSIREARLKAKARATERYLKATNNAYRKNTRAAQRVTIQNRNRFTKHIARNYLGMGRDLYN